MASNSVPHKRVYFFHAHVYCHQDQLAAARDFQARVSDVWQGDERISVHQLKDTAVGPHPLPNFEL
jgi:aromatic ring-cleaving dioxygenase